MGGQERKTLWVACRRYHWRPANGSGTNQAAAAKAVAAYAASLSRLDGVISSAVQFLLNRMPLWPRRMLR